NIMKANGQAARTAVQMAKGDIPFDAAKAQDIFKQFSDAAAKMPNLFPDNSKTGGETTASPKIWDDMAGFKAGFAKFDEDSKAAAAKAKDLDSFKTAFGDVAKNCNSCHT